MFVRIFNKVDILIKDLENDLGATSKTFISSSLGNSQK